MEVAVVVVVDVVGGEEGMEETGVESEIILFRRSVREGVASLRVVRVESELWNTSLSVVEVEASRVERRRRADCSGEDAERSDAEAEEMEEEEEGTECPCGASMEWW